jgi:hypothetical protein
MLSCHLRRTPTVVQLYTFTYTQQLSHKMDLSKCECYETFDRDTGAPVGEYVCDSCHVNNGDCICDQSEMCGWCDVRPKEIVESEEIFASEKLSELVHLFEHQRMEFQQQQLEQKKVPCKAGGECACDSCIFADKICEENVDRGRFEKWMQMNDYNRYYFWNNFVESDLLETLKWFASWKGGTFDHLDPSKWLCPQTLSKVWIARKLKNI